MLIGSLTDHRRCRWRRRGGVENSEERSSSHDCRRRRGIISFGRPTTSPPAPPLLRRILPRRRHLRGPIDWLLPVSPRLHLRRRRRHAGHLGWRPRRRRLHGVSPWRCVHLIKRFAAKLPSEVSRNARLHTKHADLCHRTNISNEQIDCARLLLRRRRRLRVVLSSHDRRILRLLRQWRLRRLRLVNSSRRRLLGRRRPLGDGHRLHICDHAIQKWNT